MRTSEPSTSDVRITRPAGSPLRSSVLLRSSTLRSSALLRSSTLRSFALLLSSLGSIVLSTTLRSVLRSPFLGSPSLLRLSVGPPALLAVPAHSCDNAWPLTSCHVHVTPGPRANTKYTPEQLRRVSKGAFYWKQALQELLPEDRRMNNYAKPNPMVFANAQETASGKMAGALSLARLIGR